MVLGNEKLRQLARKSAKDYNTSNKKGKSNIARGLVMKVRQMEPAGRFLKRNPITSAWEGTPKLLAFHFYYIFFIAEALSRVSQKCGCLLYHHTRCGR